MKKFLVIFLICSAAVVNIKAQEYKNFKTGLSIGFGKSFRENYPYGIIITVEPAWRTSDAFSVGLRIEGALMLHGIDDNYASLSYTLNGQYYLSDDGLRPFVGAGFGFYAFDNSGGTIFGFYPRIGFDRKHFSLSMDINIILSSMTYGGDVMYHYIGIRAGGFFGGGKK